ncbi:pimeloyl-ACP methyl ester carboxylesterase [Paraburkholderia sp. HC6.4b]|uniref:alpha/beta fold hydrolase n=1 Tax=unclassified Paraburkholderia TaxID=2615204 RepID=UPI001611AFBB|nr:MULTISPECIES: alpha/beta hydrolase [unclassified Paraburkholderia]MBB5406300.1 pimeloyl-ACP methyl ester carboxylesterase [Paraburkholderia sp. HC6.4b]MBB5448697.1 pimeloyl-ACP methyl ester carboxylesterase [Paraburkholderia sp. Kb1A]
MDYKVSRTRDGIGYEYISLSAPWTTTGTPVLFQHGIGDGRATWSNWLADALHSRPVIAVDLRGHGSSRDASLANFTLEQGRRDLIGVLDELGISKIHYIGSSFGGMLGYYLAATAAPRVATLTTCSAPYRGDWVRGLDRWIDLLRTEGTEPWSDEVLDAFFTDPYREREPQFISWMRTAQRSMRPEDVCSYFEATKRENLEGILPDIECPVLNITGGSPVVDRKNPRNLGSFVRQLENVTIPDSRHGIAMSHWEECSAAAYEFIARWERVGNAGNTHHEREPSDRTGGTR